MFLVFSKHCLSWHLSVLLGILTNTVASEHPYGDVWMSAWGENMTLKNTLRLAVCQNNILFLQLRRCVTLYLLFINLNLKTKMVCFGHHFLSASLHTAEAFEVVSCSSALIPLPLYSLLDAVACVRSTAVKSVLVTSEVQTSHVTQDWLSFCHKDPLRKARKWGSECTTCNEWL